MSHCPEESPAKAPLFTPGEACQAFTVMLLLNILAAAAMTQFDWPESVKGLAGTLLMDVSLLLGLALALSRRRLSWIKSFGLQRWRWPRATAIGILGCAIIFPLALLLHGAANQLLIHWGFAAPDQPALNWLNLNRSPVFNVLFFLQAFLIAPFCEELFFRGLVMRTLLGRFSTAAAVLLSSLLFAVFHCHGPALVPLFAVAAGFALAYLYTRSLAAAFVMHAAYNLVNLVWMLVLPAA
jgi:membrane protease YdiL (CAAX protease family)